MDDRDEIPAEIEAGMSLERFNARAKARRALHELRAQPGNELAIEALEAMMAITGQPFGDPGPDEPPRTVEVLER